MTVSIGPLVSPEDAYEIGRACTAHDRPDVEPLSLDGWRGRLAHPWPGQAVEHHLGLLGGDPVGLLELSFPQDDNLTTVNLELAVLPAARRRGVGRALLDLAVERARAQGRTHLIGPTSRRHPDGAAFARAAGAVPGLEETRSRLDMRTLDQPRLDAMLADAWSHADGYRLMLWTGVPPDEVIDDVAYLDGRLFADAPTGDLVWEPEKVDAERIREGELSRLRRGRATYHAGALHGDRLVAWTVICGDDGPAHAWQNNTLVDPPHRGHRLGQLVKLANLAQIRELRPGLEAIDTYNAASNEHMLRINRAMGFREVESVIEWQLTV